jgi:hypothetical protein
MTGNENGIEVFDWKTFERNTLRGFFSVKLPSGMVIHKMNLHEKGSQRWIGFPAEKYEKRDGSVGWSAMVEIPDRDRADRFRDLVVGALKSKGFIG